MKQFKRFRHNATVAIKNERENGKIRVEPATRPNQASLLKEQLALLAVLVLFSGMVSTNTYYAGFGLRYQLLDLAVPHLIYRGITAVLGNYALLTAYLAAILWLALVADYIAVKFPKFAQWVPLGTYGLISIVILLAYFSSIYSGQSSIQRDLRESTSELPVVQAMTSSKGEKLPFQGYRLMNSSKEYVIVFKGVVNDAEVPFMHILKKGDINEIVISRL